MKGLSEDEKILLAKVKKRVAQLRGENKVALTGRGNKLSLNNK